MKKRKYGSQGRKGGRKEGREEGKEEGTKEAKEGRELRKQGS